MRPSAFSIPAPQSRWLCRAVADAFGRLASRGYGRRRKAAIGITRKLDLPIRPKRGCKPVFVRWMASRNHMGKVCRPGAHQRPLMCGRPAPFADVEINLARFQAAVTTSYRPDNVGITRIAQSLTVMNCSTSLIGRFGAFVPILSCIVWWRSRKCAALPRVII